MKHISTKNCMKMPWFYVNSIKTKITIPQIKINFFHNVLNNLTLKMENITEKFFLNLKE